MTNMMMMFHSLRHVLLVQSLTFLSLMWQSVTECIWIILSCLAQM